MVITIVQWNARGLENNGPEFFEFLRQKKITPHIIAVQESFLHPESGMAPMNVPTNFAVETINKRFAKTRVARGGTTILINLDAAVTYIPVKMVTPLEAIAIKIMPSGLTICSMYIPCRNEAEPVAFRPSLEKLNDLIAQLPEPFILCCDANAHNPVWGGDLERTCVQGKLIEQWLEATDSVCLLNESGTMTYKTFRHHNITESAIDLTFASSHIAHHVEWAAERDNCCGSDHLPIFCRYYGGGTTTTTNEYDENVQVSNNTNTNINITNEHEHPGWIVKRANWALYTQLSSDPAALSNISTYTQLVQFICGIADLSIPVKRQRRRNPPNPESESEKKPWNAWWTPELTDLKAKEDAARREVQRSKAAPRAIEALNLATGRFRKRKREIELAHWESFTQRIDFRTTPSEAWKAVKQLKAKFELELEQPKNFVLEADGDDDDDEDDDDDDEHQRDSNEAFLNAMQMHPCFEYNQKNIANRFAKYFVSQASSPIASTSSTRNTNTETSPELSSRVFDDIPSISTSINTYTNTSTLDEPFTLQELEFALSRCTATSTPGPDKIPYTFIKHLSPDALVKVLRVFNDIWQTSDLPAMWKMSLVKPHLKPSRPKHQVESYRLISLPSCPGKLFERLAYNRLNWLTEHINVTPFQFAFRQHLSAEHCLQHVAHEAQYAKHQRQHLLMLNLDIKGAYPSTPHSLVLHHLEKSLKIARNSRVFTYIRSFLTDNKIQVSCNGYLSEQHIVSGTGLPQGSILSPLLFKIALIGIEKAVESTWGNKAHIVVYADDLILLVRHENLEVAKRRLETMANQVIQWLDDRRFCIAADKLAFMHLMRPPNRRRRRKTQLDNSDSDDDDDDENAEDTITITVNSMVLEAKYAHRLLGMVLNEQMSFKEHVSAIKSSVGTWVNLMRCLANRTFQAPPHIQLNLYRNAIRPRIEYGSVAYSAANKDQHQHLDTLQNNCIRIAVGAFKSTPIEHLQRQAGVVPLQVRRDVKVIKMLGKQMAMGSNHPTYALHQAQSISLESLRKQLTTIEPHVALRALKQLEHWQASNYLTLWSLCPIPVNLDMRMGLKKRDVLPIEYVTQFNQLRHTKFSEHHFIYTDGSRIIRTPTPTDPSASTSSSSSATYAVYDDTLKKKVEAIRLLNDNFSSFSAELIAILQALKYIDDPLAFSTTASASTPTPRHRNSTIKHFCIATDCLSACQVLSDPTKLLKSDATHRELLTAIFDVHHRLAAEKGFSVTVCWIPSHVGIRGNEMADQMALEAHDERLRNTYADYLGYNNTNMTSRTFRLPFQDFCGNLKAMHNETVCRMWEKAAEQRAANGKRTLLHDHQKKNGVLKRDATYDKLPRHHQVAIARLRMQHTRLTHQHLFETSSSEEEGQSCSKCGTPENTVEHILESCEATLDKRTEHNVSTKSLFRTARDAQNVIKFLIETNQLYDI